MTFLTKRHITRRTFLRGLGVTMSLPLLDSMVPAQTPLARTAANPQIRLGLCFIPHGGVMNNWTPAEEGALTLSRTLTPLEPFKNQVVVVSNLAHKMAAPAGPGDNGGDHTRSPAVFLNGVHPKRTDGADIHAGVTIDQIAAQKIGLETPLPSLELATEDYSGLVGSCDVGFSCAYMNTISWRTPTTPLPMEINPRLVFDRLFGDGATAAERLNESNSSAASRRDHRPGTASARRLGCERSTGWAEYLIQCAIERRIQLAEKQNTNSDLSVPRPPSGIPKDDHQEHTKLMFDLMALSFQADITHFHVHDGARSAIGPSRCSNFLKASTRRHIIKTIPERLENLTKINTYHVSLAGASAQDAEGDSMATAICWTIR
jgi:hypothetical protein